MPSRAKLLTHRVTSGLLSPWRTLALLALSSSSDSDGDLILEIQFHPFSEARKQFSQKQGVDRSIRFGRMASSVNEAGEPIPTSAVLISTSKHISTKCRNENIAFLKCKKNDPNPEKCLEKGRQVTRCVLTLLKDIHEKCTKEMDAYAGCMYYNTNEFELCRKEQTEFEKVCPLE